MDAALAASLAVLALIDSTSFGTLLIPIWLLLAPGRVRAGRIMVYLGTIAVCYFAVGVAIALGASRYLPQISALLETVPAQWLQLALGIGLIVLSFIIDPGKRRRERRPEGGGRVMRWRERALGADAAATGATTTTRQGSTLPLIGLAAAAATAEVATMLPYLAAIGLVTTAGLGTGWTTATMAAYCLVMVLPALALLGARLLARSAVEPLLVRINAWMSKHAASTTAWVVGIVGFLLARDAAGRLGLLEALSNL